jgi:cytolysin-activating lysine-acyltransferase
MFFGKKPTTPEAAPAPPIPQEASTAPSFGAMFQPADPIVPAPSAPAAPSVDPEMQRKLADARLRIHAAVGQVVLALTVVPRYRHQTVADLQTLVLEPLMRDRVAIASAKHEDGSDGAGGSLAGIAFWATVSEAVDLSIREQIKGGAFPIRLKPEDWNSGDKVWLLDVIAPSQKMASSVLANFTQVVKSSAEVRIHPMVARQVDPELLRKMGAVADGA